MHVYVPFAKTNDEERMVYGLCTSEAKDSQGEIVTRKAIRKAWEEYMEYANIREMHQPSAVGVTKEYEHNDEGTWIGVKVVDDTAWKKVKEGVYKGFSIGGRVLKKSKNIIEEITLAEISLVDRPANPDAKFSAIKVDGGLVDRLTEDKIKAMKKYVEIDGVKYQEDPEKPGEALVADGEKVLFVEEDEAPAADAPAADAPAADAPAADAPAADAPASDAPDVDAPAADAPVVEEAAPVVDLSKWQFPAEAKVSKDTMGVITLASCLDHLNYIKTMFDMNGKDTEGIDKIMDVCKSLIAKEATEKESAAPVGDLAKTLGSELSKVMAPVLEKLGTVEGSVAEIRKDVDAIKGTKVSPRPKAAVPVEKVIENGVVSKGAKDIAAKRAELEAVEKEINAHALTMQGASASEMPAMAAKSTELFTKYRGAQRELNDMLAGVTE